MNAMALERVSESMIGGMPEVRLEWHMDNFRRYMRSEDVGSDYPSRSTGFVAGGYSTTFDELMDASDIRCARAVDALVSGLSVSERAAIHHNYLRAVFRFPRDNFPSLLRVAREKIARGLVMRGFY